MTPSAGLVVEVKHIAMLARDIQSFELDATDGGPLPSFTAGAHIDVHLGNDIVRSYSLCNSQAERHRYVIAVARSAGGRGGSLHMHERIRPGDRLRISPPRNHFPLAEDAAHTVLIAGGIGITPLWSMAQRLEELGRSWELVYCARTRAHAAFLQALSAAPYAGKVRHVFDGEPGGTLLDLAGFVAGFGGSTHLYCCGPKPMLDAFKAATSRRLPDTVHLEYFSGTDAAATDGGFTVTLARSKKDVHVAPGKTILDALADHQIHPPFSCREGSCGVCLTRVLAGTPDHRDIYLSDAEHQANDVMAICCSGSRSPSLVLDM